MLKNIDLDLSGTGWRMWKTGTAIIAVPLAAILLYFALRGVEWKLVWKAVASAHIGFLALGCLLAHVSYFLRSLRWRVMLSVSGPLGISVVFWATMAGYFSNNLLPARAGEVVRSIIISSHSGLSKTYVLTTALTERILDAVVLVAAGSVILIYVGKGPEWWIPAAETVGTVAAAALIVLIILPSLDEFLGRIVMRLPVNLLLRSRFVEVFGQLAEGIRSLHHLGRFTSFSVLTAAIWLLDAVGCVTCARALGLSLSIPVAILLLSALGLGSAIPSTPGYVGIYQFVAVTVLVPFGFSRNDSLAFILTAQFFNYLVVGAWALIGIWRLGRMPGRRHFPFMRIS